MQQRFAIPPVVRQWIFPVVIVLLIWWLQQFPGIIETYYAQGIYPYIGSNASMAVWLATIQRW